MTYINYLPQSLALWLENNAKEATDITLINDKNMFITEKGYIKESPFFVSKNLLYDIVMKMCKGSMYANQNTLKDGYITLGGGHRVGVVGTVVNESGKSTYMREISALNIRISRDIYGAADKIMPYIKSENRVYNTLIISPPSCGKTTALRDVARQLGNCVKVGVVDERSEIVQGKCVGKYVFSLDGCSKHEGILMLLRSMAPSVIITDEIGSEEDETAIKKLINAGVKIICTAHGYDEKDVMRRKVLAELITDGAFERLIILSAKNGAGTLEKVINI